MKRDYPELEGKEIIYVYGHSRERGVVAGVNFDIGISIDSTENYGTHLLCLHGPIFKGKSNYCKTSYKTEFYATIAAIKRGIIYTDKIAKVEFLKSGVNYDHPFGSVGTCSYIG